MTKTTKCHGCQEHFQDHDECLAHLATNKACQAEIKILGKTFCFVCDRSYEKVPYQIALSLKLTRPRCRSQASPSREPIRKRRPHINLKAHIYI